MKHIPYGRQDISDTDVATVVEVLKSDWITQGPAIERFEKAVAKYCGARYAVAVSSGTAALHIACLAAGLAAGDYLWTSPNTFVASANCAIYCGAQVDFVDIDPRTYNMSPERLAEKLGRAGATNRLPKVAVPVHFSGQPCAMQRIRELSAEYGFLLIEDASHAIGGDYRQSKVGSCTLSDMTVFSFHPVKIITTGEGGMVLTNREDLYEKLLRLRNHGITRDPMAMLTEPDGPWFYQQIDLGYNYRLTDLQAALGLSQLQRIDAFVARRRELAVRYNQALHDLPLTLPWQHPDSRSAYHLYVIRLNLQLLEKTRLEVFEALRQAGIGVNVHYIPVHTQPYYRRLGFERGDFPEAERYYDEAITLPLYYALSEDEQDYVIDNLKKVLR